MSVRAVHPPAFDGGVGASVSLLPPGRVGVAVLDCGERFPAPSLATT